MDFDLEHLIGLHKKTSICDGENTGRIEIIQVAQKLKPVAPIATEF